jgi:Cdc6-like AAA superfamily ATPase
MNTKGNIVDFKLPSTSKERPITVNKMRATLHPWVHSSKEIVVNHSANISKISNAISDLEKDSKPKIIGIEGSTGSGKSILAKVLNANANNCQLIDVCSLIDYSADLFELDALEISASTCIIDEASFVQEQSLFNAMEKTAIKNGVLVLLFQTASDFSEKIKNTELFKDMKCFKLSRDGLTLIETL